MTIGRVLPIPQNYESDHDVMEGHIILDTISAVLRPFGVEQVTVPLSELSADLEPARQNVCGVRPVEVPLLVLNGTRPDSTFSVQPSAHSLTSHFRMLGPLRSVGALASTQTGFLMERVPDFRFSGPLRPITDLCRAAAAEYARRDTAGFRAWLVAHAGTLPAAPILLRSAESLPASRAEMLMVPLIYLNHMWRQGNPDAEPATGPSTMPSPLHELLESVASAIGTIPRFNQIIMTMLAWELDGRAGGEVLTHRDITNLDRMRPAFWLNQDDQSELDLYRAFFAVEAFGVPLYGWGCYALECAAVSDRTGGLLALRMVHAAIRNVYMLTRNLIPRIDPGEFRRIQVTCGWVEDEVTGVASGYQLPFMLMLDALFHVNFSHPDVIAARANNLRFVPEDWKAFFRMIYDHQPALKTWVRETRDTVLTEAYQSCVDIFTLFRKMHQHLGGKAIKGGTTTGRVFDSSERNYVQFMTEMSALVGDTAEAGDLTAPVFPDSPAAAASRGAEQ
jgi:hypothetical protein